MLSMLAMSGAFQRPNLVMSVSVYVRNRQWWRCMGELCNQVNMIKPTFLSRDVQSWETSLCQPWYLNLPLNHVMILPLFKFVLVAFSNGRRKEVWNVDFKWGIFSFLETDCLWFDWGALQLMLHIIDWHPCKSVRRVIEKVHAKRHRREINVVNTLSLLIENGMYMLQCNLLCLYIFNKFNSHCTTTCKYYW